MRVRKSERCYFCGGPLEMKMATIPFVVESSVVVVKEIPAKVCVQCDEPVMESAVAASVDRLLKQAYQAGFEVSVVTYTEAELALA